MIGIILAAALAHAASDWTGDAMALEGWKLVSPNLESLQFVQIGDVAQGSGKRRVRTEFAPGSSIFKSSAMLLEVECFDPRFRVVAIDFYAGRNLSGEHETGRTTGEWRYTKPFSEMDKTLTAICEGPKSDR